jgi:hypothetical protein
MRHEWRRKMRLRINRLPCIHGGEALDTFLCLTTNPNQTVVELRFVSGHAFMRAVKAVRSIRL